MTKIAATYRVIFTNGERRDFLAHSLGAARTAAYAWLCTSRPLNVFIAKVERAI